MEGLTLEGHNSCLWPGYFYYRLKAGKLNQADMEKEGGAGSLTAVTNDPLWS